MSQSQILETADRCNRVVPHLLRMEYNKGSLFRAGLTDHHPLHEQGTGAESISREGEVLKTLHLYL